MRFLCVSAGLVAVLAFVAGCEDGPNQPYSPSPSGASGVWSSLDGGVAVAEGGQPFDAAYPTTGATTLCSTDFKRQRWAWMLTQPIQPPRFYAGLDMAGGDTWQGLTIGQAETPPSDPNADGGGLCQSVPQGAIGTCPSGFGSCDQNYWGNNQEVSFTWNVATHRLDQMVINLGYTGSLTTGDYPDNMGQVWHYTVTPGDVVRRAPAGSMSSGNPYLLDWNGSPAALHQEITNIFNAAMAQYATQGGIPWNTSTCSDDSVCAPDNEVCQCQHDPSNPAACVKGTQGKCGDKDCGADGFCLIYNAAWIFGIRPLAFYVQGTAGVPQPQLSTPTSFYNFWVKWEPYSYIPQDVELGPNGPIAQGKPAGAKDPNAVCTQQIGTTFGDMVNNCVAVAADPAVNTVNINKITNGLTHDQEHWTANLQGVNQNFTSLKVANDPNAVVQDSDQPQPGDLAQDWTYDLRARGHTANDYNPLPSTTRGRINFRASSLIYIEWARLVLQDIANNQLHLAAPKTLGDPTCTGFNASGVPNYKSTTGCSGIEGLIIPGRGPAGPAQLGPGYLDANGNFDFSKDPVRPDLNPASNWDNVNKFYGSTLRPGSATGALCIDPLTQTDCDVTELPQGLASVWQVMLNHVVRVLGNGNVHNLPPEMRDARYYFRWFGVAFVKYLKAYGNYNNATRDNFPNATAGSGLGPSDVLAQPVDREALFFDYLEQTGTGAAQTFDKFEYVDRDFIGKGAGGAYNWIPWDFSYGSDILGGNQRYDDWFRRMDREEIAMYSAMLTDKTHTPGQEDNVNITNLAGSPLLQGTWPSYACAIGQYSDPGVKGGNECGGQYPPLDPTNPSAAALCPTGTCTTAGQVCIQTASLVAGNIAVCANPCNYTTYPTSGCGPTQACVQAGAVEGCVDMQMDKNGPHPCVDGHGNPLASCPAPSVIQPRPLLFRYPGAWTRTPFSLGHSPITLHSNDKHAGTGVAKITIPNFAAGPYTPSPLPAAASADGGAGCGMGYTLSQDGVWCNAALNSGTGTTAPQFTPLTPWLEVGGGQTQNGGPVGFGIPQDGQRVQFITTGQLDFSGVLESYVVDYVPYTDPVNPSCVSTGQCNAGYTCDPNSHQCVTNDDTIRIDAIEGQDFTGQAFLCQDPTTNDILHVGMYDSAYSILDWLAKHPGSPTGGNASAQSACNILIRISKYGNAVDDITSLTQGVFLNLSGGQGQGRVTDVIAFDPSLIQSF